MAVVFPGGAPISSAPFDSPAKKIESVEHYQIPSQLPMPSPTHSPHASGAIKDSTSFIRPPEVAPAVPPTFSKIPGEASDAGSRAQQAQDQVGRSLRAAEAAGSKLAAESGAGLYPIAGSHLADRAASLDPAERPPYHSPFAGESKPDTYFWDDAG